MTGTSARSSTDCRSHSRNASRIVISRSEVRSSGSLSPRIAPATVMRDLLRGQAELRGAVAVDDDLHLLRRRCRPRSARPRVPARDESRCATSCEISASRSVDSPDELQAERRRSARALVELEARLADDDLRHVLQHAAHDFLRRNRRLVLGLEVEARVGLVGQPERVVGLDVEPLLVRLEVGLDALHGLLDLAPSGRSRSGGRRASACGSPPAGTDPPWRASARTAAPARRGSAP